MKWRFAVTSALKIRITVKCDAISVRRPESRQGIHARSLIGHPMGCKGLTDRAFVLDEHWMNKKHRQKTLDTHLSAVLGIFGCPNIQTFQTFLKLRPTSDPAKSHLFGGVREKQSFSLTHRQKAIKLAANMNLQLDGCDSR
jgi:hypothetical protein